MAGVATGFKAGVSRPLRLGGFCHCLHEYVCVCVHALNVCVVYVCVYVCVCINVKVCNVRACVYVCVYNYV